MNNPSTISEAAITDTAIKPDDEGGYIIAMTALLLVPLMIFAAFAVDVGAWYAKADQTQRAADAAALAGVVFMPDFAEASIQALATAKANGFDNADPEISVIPERQNDQGLRVTIRTKGEAYFGKAALDGIDIERYARAQYILPVPMGNPSSMIGSGNATGPIIGDPTEHLFLAINSWCLGRDNGDPISVRSLGHLQCGSNNNPTYAATGYDFIIDFGAAPVGLWDIEIFEPGSCTQSNETAGANGTSIQTTLWKADDTQFTDDDNIADPNLRVTNSFDNTAGPGPYEWGDAVCGTAANGGWVKAYRADPVTDPGRWILRVAGFPRANETGLNSFGIRAVPAPGFTGAGVPCGSIGGSAACPRVSAREWLPIFIPPTVGGGSNFGTDTAAFFYLAEIDTVHAGKTLQVTLFDPGEGMANLQILDPNGVRYAFRAEVNGGPAAGGTAFTNNTQPEGGALCTTDNENGVGTTNQICLRVTNAQFNGDEVQLEFDIPDAYACGTRNGDTDCWWRVRYQRDTGTNPPALQDRTSWKVRVVGDPIRLVE